MQTPQQDLAELRPPYSSDEIDLGELIRKLLSEWKLISAITVVGAIASVFFALNQTSIYRIEAVITAPSISELGKITDQTLIPISPERALERVFEQLISAQNQNQQFAKSDLFNTINAKSDHSAEQIFLSIQKEISIARIDREFYSVNKDERAPFKEVNVSLESAHPAEAQTFINALTISAMESALIAFTEDASTTRQERIIRLEEKLVALTSAAKESRLAEIKRLEAQSALRINELELELTLLEQKAKTDRENRISQLKESLKAAKSLDITDPVTWDDLRTSSSRAQILNDISGSATSTPLFFQGSRIITAEISMLEGRTNDLLYVGKASTIQLELETLKAATKIKALKARENDTIYLESYNKLTTQISQLQKEPNDFSSSALASLVQPAILPTQPIKPNRKLIVVAGTVLAGFLGLFIALIRLAVRK